MRPKGRKLYHLGFRGKVARSTLADANESRGWRIFADFAHRLIATARGLYVRDPMGVDLDESLYALDSTTIDLCLALFPWARFRRRKAAVKLHTLLDLRGNIPTFLRVTNGKVHDVNLLDEIMPEAGAFYVMDRGYIDFQRLFVLTLGSAFFVVRTKSNVLLQRRYSHAVDKSTGVRSDQTGILSSYDSASVYPDTLRRVSYVDAETGKRLKFLTNHFALPALTIAQIYKQRWQVELFFKWIKQHLRIKAFYGTSENAVKRKSGLRSRCTCWWRSYASGWDWRPACTRFYRFSAPRFLRKRLLSFAAVKVWNGFDFRREIAQQLLELVS